MKARIDRPALPATAALQAETDAPHRHAAATGQWQVAAAASPRQVAQRQRISQLRGGGNKETSRNGLPETLRAGIESLSGVDMSDVQVRHDSAEPAKLQAHAYARGNVIHLAPGQERHLPHEAWHVAQQRQGRVRPTTAVAGVKVNDDPSLEGEADRMGEQALRSAKDGEPGP
jgi:hypothetical protein